jgi:hypothetical protein
LEFHAALFSRRAWLLLLLEVIADGDACRKRGLLGAEEGGNWVVAAKQPAGAREQNDQWLATVKIILSARWLAKNAL